MKKDKTEPAPNIAFVGVHSDGTKKEVPEFVNFARGRKLVIPDVKHGEGFHHEDAALLINSSRDFKAFVNKGAKK